jgi:hypothetical protein
MWAAAVAIGRAKLLDLDDPAINEQIRAPDGTMLHIIAPPRGSVDAAASFASPEAASSSGRGGGSVAVGVTRPRSALLRGVDDVQSLTDELRQLQVNNNPCPQALCFVGEVGEVGELLGEHPLPARDLPTPTHACVTCYCCQHTTRACTRVRAHTHTEVCHSSDTL